MKQLTPNKIINFLHDKHGCETRTNYHYAFYVISQIIIEQEGQRAYKTLVKMSNSLVGKVKPKAKRK